MFAVSNDAAAAIRRLLARPGVPQGCGLRIQPAADPGRLRILLVSAPTAGDFVRDAEGARLYVAQEVAGRLQGRTLSVKRSEAGRVQFVLDPVAAASTRHGVIEREPSSEGALLSS